MKDSQTGILHFQRTGKIGCPKSHWCCRDEMLRDLCVKHKDIRQHFAAVVGKLVAVVVG